MCHYCVAMSFVVLDDVVGCFLAPTSSCSCDLVVNLCFNFFLLCCHSSYLLVASWFISWGICCFHVSMFASASSLAVGPAFLISVQSLNLCLLKLDVASSLGFLAGSLGFSLDW